jgi:tRNA U38,U39,U40 pseudouridine synthase TruA
VSAFMQDVHKDKQLSVRYFVAGRTDRTVFAAGMHPANRGSSFIRTVVRRMVVSHNPTSEATDMSLDGH